MKEARFGSYDAKAVEQFIKDIQAMLPGVEVNINNVNDFAVMLEEHKRCASCLGLAHCENSTPGHSMEYENGMFKAKECRFKKEEATKHNSLIKTLYLPKTILEAKLEDYHTNSESRKKIYKHIVNFVGNFGDETFSKGLFLYGSFSMGKTYSLAVIANELAKKNVNSLLIYFPDLVLDLKNAIGTPRFEELVNMLKEIDVLMLDDLGAENLTPWIRDEILGPVINYRATAKKPLYVSSNLNPKDLTNHLAIDDSPTSVLKAQRITSRMSGLLVSVCMDDGENYKR